MLNKQNRYNLNIYLENKIFKMKIISNENLPVSNGHYSQCIEHNGMLYLSGQLPIHDKIVPATIDEQTILVLKKVETILIASGSDINNILQVRIYIPDIRLWDQVNEVYSRFFKNHSPVRCIVPTGKLHFGCLIELEVTAILNN